MNRLEAERTGASPTDRPWRGGFRLERAQIVPRDIGEVFAFFSDPRNLGELTPPRLHFRLLSSSTPSVQNGTLLDYALRVRGIPVRWRSRIGAWNPPRCFVDEQVLGPYQRWIHEHRFEDLGGRTRVTDEVRYSVLGGALVDRFIVRPDLERIFDYRKQRLAAIFGS